MNEPAPSSYRPLGPLVSDPLGPYRGPWTPRLAAHLLRRAGFGGSPSDRAHTAAATCAAAVDAFVNAPVGGAYPLPDLVAGQDPVMGALRDPDAQKMLREARRQQTIDNVTWWLDRMLATPAPLQEKLTLLLHGHFATDENTKGIYGLDIVRQNELLRKYALGNWRDLTHYVARDVAMLKWLDNARSVKAHPNENFARELMELFTLGIGNYTENDVRESARAFTGFTFARLTGEFYFDERQHDDGQKTFLGQTGGFNGDDVIEIIFRQPAAARWFATKLLTFFVYSDPEPELVEALAAVIRRHDFDMKPVLATLLRSNVFYSERAYRALVKSPIEFVVGSYQLFGITSVKPAIIGPLTRMGQVPFHPPSVKGWDGGAAWLNTQTVLARENFASGLMAAPETKASSWLTARIPRNAADATAQLVGTILDDDASDASRLRLTRFLDGDGTSADGALSVENYEERMHGGAYLTMAMPAYQLS